MHGDRSGERIVAGRTDRLEGDRVGRRRAAADDDHADHGDEHDQRDTDRDADDGPPLPWRRRGVGRRVRTRLAGRRRDRGVAGCGAARAVTGGARLSGGLDGGASEVVASGDGSVGGSVDASAHCWR